MSTTSLLDMENDLTFGDVCRASVDIAQAAQQTFVTTPAFKEPCGKCRGTGRYQRGFSQYGSQCFACKGAGFHMFKTSPESRAKKAAARVERQEAEARAEKAAKGAMVTAWRQANPEAAAWIDANDGRFDFATNMSNALVQWGALTPNQLAAIHRCIEKSKVRQEEAQARVAAAPTVNVTELEDAFQRALNAGLKRVRLNMGSLEVKPAKVTSANPGALYVTNDGEYLGKVMGGRFLRVRACDDQQEAQVLKLLADPKAAAQAYGIETGVCCICSRELTDPVSIAQGIGPICAGRFGW